MYKRRDYNTFSWLAFSISLVVCLAIAGLVWYALMVPINIHSHAFWWMIILGLGASTILSCAIAEREEYEFSKTLIVSLVFLALAIIWLVLTLFSSRMIHADTFKNVAQIETNGVFAEDIPAIDSSDDIPIIDKATAQKLGDRAMGTMEKYLSQYEVSSEYNLISYNGSYYRVSPLMYGGLFKYSNSKSVGIPAYILVDVYTGKVELIELEEGKTIQYSPSAFFSKDLTRHIRSNYPTAILGEANFEIDDEGNPYYIVSTLKGNAGVFGAPNIKSVLLVDAVTGQITEYEIDDVPEWVDNVYDVTRIMTEIDWAYSLVNGFFNFSQKQVRKTSYSFDNNQYYSIPKDGHVYVYTGVTSAGGDEANIGFLLINMRNGKATYYSDPGAEESSAQESAKGLVQQYGYSAGPVMLVNINGEQTYFFALKDAQLLVKKYALVNKEDYTLVVVEDSIEQAVDVYREKLNLGDSEIIEAPEAQTKTGTVASVYEVTMDGNTMFIFYFEGSNELFISKISNSFEQPAKLIPTAKVTIGYNVIDGTNVVSTIKFN